MNAAAVLRVIVEAQTGPANASLAKFDSNLRASAAEADAAMGRVAKSSEKTALAGKRLEATGEKAVLAGKRIEATGRSISSLGTKLAYATAPIAAVGAVSVKMALDFKRSMGLIATDAGGSAREVKKLEKSVLGLARTSQYSPKQLADSLFHVESSGYRGAKAIKVLNESQKLATSGNSDLEATTYALVSATKALNSGDSLKGLTKTAAQLNEIVSHGDIRLEELTSAMSTGLLPTARGLGLGVADVGSALDVMTKRGVPAQRSAYALNFTLQKLIPSTEKAQDVFKELGIGQEQLLKIAQTGGLPAALDLLKQKLEVLPKGRQIQEIDEMFGGGRMSKGLLIAIQHVGEMKQLYGEVDGNVQLYKKHVREAEQQPLVKMKAAWSSIEADLVEIGSDLLPVIVPAFESLVGLASGAAHAFTAMPHGLQTATIDAGLFAIGLSGGLIAAGKLLEAIGSIREAMAGLAATNLATSLLGGAGDLGAALRMALGGDMVGLQVIGGEWAASLMGGLTTALPALAAAAGIANIVYSASHGDWEKAGFKAGGALVGGIAGAFIGPEGAMLGAGAGSALGGLLEPLFVSAKGLTPLQRELQATAHHTAAAFKAQHDAALKLAGAEKRLQAEQQHSKRTSQAVHQAEARLAHDRKEFGADSLRVRKDELLLAEAKAKNNTATKRLNDLQQLTGNRLKVYRFETTKAVASDKLRIQALSELKARLERKLKTEEQSNVPLVKQMQTRKRLAATEEQAEHRVKSLSRLLEEAATRVSPHYAESLNRMNLAQAQFGKHLHTLSQNVSAFGTTSVRSLDNFERAWLTMTQTSDAHTETWNRVTLAGIRSIMGEVTAASKKLGLGSSKVEFKIHGEKAQGHQQGGFTVPGSGSGDKYRTSVPAGSFILNREAASAFGFQGGGHVPVVLEPRERVFMPHEVDRVGAHNLAAMNAAVPRFQKGGSLGPEPHLSGPSGALLTIGQGAIHDVYKGAQSWLSKHQSHGVAVPGGGGPVVAQIARVLFANGFNKIAAAGIIGNAYRESNWNPAAVGTGGGGLWGFTTGAISLAALQAAAKRAKVPWTDVAFQTGFMLRHGGMGLRGVLNHASSAGEAARIFMEQWERPGIPALGEREGAARRALAMGYQKGGFIPGDPRRKWAGWDGAGVFHGVQHLAKGGTAKDPKRGSPSDAVAWAMHHLGSGDQWGYPGEWCGAFVAADMRAHHLPVPSGYPSAASWASYGNPLGRNNVQAGAILDYGSAHVALAVSSSKQIQGNDIHGQVGTSGIGGIIGGSPLTAVRWPPYGTAPGAGGSFSEKVPAVFHGARTHSLSFGALPKTIAGARREIARREHEVRIYRHAAAAASGAPATQAAIQHNITALEKRLSELRRALQKLRQEAAKKHYTKKLGRALGQTTGYEKLIEGKQRAYNRLSEYAGQVVDLEPQEAILPASATDAQREAAERAYAASYESYVNTRERPAYERVLESEADWRNTILRAQLYGFGKGKPSAAGLERGWEKGIRSADNDIEAINAFTKKVGDEKAKWNQDHPKTAFPKWLKEAIAKDEKERGRLPMLRFRDRELRKVLGEGRAEFYPGFNKAVQPPAPPLAGTGSLEQSLIEVQGILWPDLHGLMATLPASREAGKFGGAIWETQSAIEELGLRIAQVNAGLGGASGGGSDDSERVQLLEELLLHEHQEKAGRAIEEKTFGERGKLIPHAGAYASGGLVTALVGEQGPEIAAFPTGTRIHNARETSSMLQRSITVNVYEAEGLVEVEEDGQKLEATVNRMERRKARGASRRLATPGKFGV